MKLCDGPITKLFQPVAIRGKYNRDSLADWYRYLNSGYHVPCVGGTDKMSAVQQLGSVRTYARLQNGEPFSYDTWKKGVNDFFWGVISCRPLDRRMLVVSVDYKINKRDKLKSTFSHIARPHSGRAIWEGQRDIMFFI